MPGLPTARLIALALAALVSGCGSGNENPLPGDTVTIYSSLPAHGVSAPAARAVAAGEALALADAGSRAGHRRVRLVRLESTRPGGRVWEPALVSGNAKRAAGDSTAVAYLGELDYGASAVSVPITNEEDILQVSPGDGLASLTSVAPGRPQNGPARYYPSDRRTFLRLTASDLRLAEAMLEQARASGARRLAVVFDGQIYGRELAAQLLARGRRDGPGPVAAGELEGDPADMPDLVEDLAGEHPDALVYAGVTGPLTAPLFAALARRLPRTPVFAAPGILARTADLAPAPEQVEAITTVAPAGELGAAARRLLRRIARHAGLRRVGSEALNGYESMRLALEAAKRGGASRRRVVRAAIERGARSPLVHTDRFYLYRLRDGRFGFERELR